MFSAVVGNKYCKHKLTAGWFGKMKTGGLTIVNGPDDDDVQTSVCCCYWQQPQDVGECLRIMPAGSSTGLSLWGRH